MRGFRSPLALLSLVVLALVALVGAPRPATADAKKDIEVKIKEAMENYDLFEYEEARKQLNTALTLAKKNKLESQPIVAKVHISLGIVYFAGLKDEASAKLAFLSAVEIDPKIQIDAAYRSAEMAKLLDEARSEQAVASVDTGGGNAGGGVDCGSVTGLQHTIIEEGTKGAKRDLEAYLGGDVTATKVVIKYRPQGQEKFSEISMTKQGDCKYTGAIPAKAMNSDLVHYYVAAIGTDGREAASKGSEGSPNIIELTAMVGGGTGTDDDNPFEQKPDNTDKRDKGPTGGVVAGGKKSTVFVAVAIGTGAGYVSGKTEQQQNEVECCIAPGLLHVAPEVGYYISKQLAISLAGRIGFPLGANIDGHASIGPAGFLKIRYALNPRGYGFNVTGGAGGGIIRNTIKLTETDDPNMDTDIVAFGPLLVSAGAGYSARLGGNLRLNADLNIIAGIPVVKTIGESHLNFGVEFDFALGILIGF
jgi:hypothetical protein